MRLRALVVFGAAYYLGARAGRHRYEQINRVLDRLVDSDLGGRARAVADLGVERARDALKLAPNPPKAATEPITLRPDHDRDERPA